MIWLLVPAGFYVLACAVLWLFQERLIFVPYRDLVPTRIRAQDVWLPLADGTRIHAWWIVPGERTAEALLFCHGNAGNLSHREESLEFFASLGYSTLIFDYPGYGRSSGSPSQEGTAAAARAAFDWLRQEAGYPAGTVTVFGRSLGGNVALRLVHDLLAEGQRPRAAIAEASFASLADVAQRHYPWLPVRLLLRHPFDNRRRLPAIDVPVLVVHAKDDEIVPIRHGRQIYELLPGPKRWLEIPGRHNGAWLESLEAYRTALREFAR